MSKNSAEHCGAVSHDEALNIAMGYIDRCFGNPEKPERRITHSIPANHRRDSDLRLTAYIEQQRQAASELARAMAVVNEAIEYAADGGPCLFCEAEPGEEHEDCALVDQGFITRDGARR